MVAVRGVRAAEETFDPSREENNDRIRDWTLK
jgi:hypothetical protein